MGGSATVYKGRWKSRDMTVAVKTSVQGIPDSEVWFKSQYIMRIKAGAPGTKTWSVSSNYSSQ